MQLVDTHAHLYWDSFKDDFDQILQRSLDAYVSVIVNVGVDVEKSKQAVILANKVRPESALSEDSGGVSLPRMTFYSTIGIHPHEAVKYSQNPDELIARDISTLERIFVHHPKKVIAVGECGLDFLFESNPDWLASLRGRSGIPLSTDQIKDLQRKLFKAQIDLAKKLNLPLIVHCRDDRTKNPENSECWDEVIEMTKDYKGIYHCYSGLPKTTNYLLQTTNFFISFAGNITYPKNDYLREAVKFLPLEKILLETDCPFLAPQSIRGQRNEPSSVKEIAQLISELKGISLEEVATQTTSNFKSLFGLK